jgi:hypothetical protein
MYFVLQGGLFFGFGFSVETSHHVLLGQRSEIVNVKSLCSKGLTHVLWNQLAVELRSN